ncbi:MAG: phospholipid carrier-dependent glycosyltransferase, partial [Chloroflexota bacterium]
MTRDSVRERGARPPAHGLPLDPETLVLLLILLGVLLRVVVGGLYMPLSGFRVDVGDFALWAQRMATAGPGEFYQPGYLADYPPGYMYVLWLLGAIGEWLRPVFGLSITPGLIKVPGILADAGVAWVLFIYARRFGDGWLGSWSGARLGVVAVVIYLFNPGTIFDSAVWGQVDSVGTLVLLATLYALARGWTEVAGAGAVLAMLVKFQFGFLIPLVAIVGLKRHLFGRSSDPQHAGRRDPARVLSSLAAGLGTLVLMIVPFRLAIWAPNDPTHSLVDRLVAASNTYQGLTINAFNIWRNPWSGLGDRYAWGCDSAAATSTCADGAGVAFILGSVPISWQLVGTLMFALAALVALVLVERRDDPTGILVGALALAVAFFALPTRVHERYLFPALALAAPLVARSWRWAVLYGVITLSFFANVYWLYTTDFSFAGGDKPMNPGIFGQAMPRDPFLAQFLFNDTMIYLLSLMIVVALGWILTQAIAMMRGTDELPAGHAVDTGLWPALPPPVADTAAPNAPPGGRWIRVPAWLRRDPNPPGDEPPRRLDRLDLILLIGLVVFAFLFRLWRLDLPRHTHFDEVYHARSATEWLADWQQGWSRDTYEWTHPPLAKYLIAAGIVVANPNQVVGGTDLDEPATVMAVAPQRTAFGRPASVVFTSAGDEQITARDAVSGELVSTWQAPGPVASLAYDEDDDRLLVGLTGDGSVAAYDMAAFLGQLGERGPPPGVAQIETDLAGVTQIVVPDGQLVILFGGPDGIVEVERATGVVLASSPMGTTGIGYLPAGSGDDPPPPRVLAIDVGRGTLVVLDGGTLQPSTSVTGDDGEMPLAAEAAGPILVQGSGKNTQVWVPVGPLPADEEHGPVLGGLSVFDENLQLTDTVPLPGPAVAIGWQQVANVVYVAGIDARTDQPVVWTVNPLGSGGTQSAGFATFDTTVLPGEALALAFDISDHALGDDHARLLVSVDEVDRGRLVAIDAGSNAFAWRLSGVLFGSLLVGIIYLFAATLFSRRRIAVMAAAFVAIDGMSYTMSRISMNDIFVATFIVAAYALFWQVWSGRWARSAWWA